jgi:hypothetical protein
VVIRLNEIGKSLKSKGEYWISFTGDSITSTEWVHPNWRDIVIYVLHQELTKLLHGDWKTPEWGLRGFNFAYDGATTKDILERVDEILLVKPDLVISLMGGGDSENNISVEEHKRNIEKIASELTASGSEVVWCTTIPALSESGKNEKYLPYRDAFLQIQESEKFHRLDVFELYKDFPLERLFTFKTEEGEIDPEHPNQLGNAYIAKVILKEVFGIEFDPKKYIENTLKGEKYPGY